MSHPNRPALSIALVLVLFALGLIRLRDRAANRATGRAGRGPDAAASLPAAGYRRALGACGLSQGGGSRAHRGSGHRSVQAALRDHAWAERRRHDAPCRSGNANRAAPERRTRRQNLHRAAEDPPGSAQDREVVLFDGRILILRWMDSEVQGRYGTMVYVRCGAEGAKRTAAKPKSKPKTALPPKPAQ